MNKLIRLSPTAIEYGDYAWNFASGCGNQVEGRCKSGGFKCWAYSISQRFENHYPNGFKPTIYPAALLSPLYLKKPSRLLCAFMGDLFWDCPEFNPSNMINVPILPGLSHAEPLKEQIFRTINKCPQHTFLFLTKQPQNLIKFQFPDNCWVGVTVCNDEMFDRAIFWLNNVQAHVRFISFEPLLSKLNIVPHDVQRIIDWLIIGACTGTPKDLMELQLRYPDLEPVRYGGKLTLQPKIEWVREIVEAADKAGIPVFLKDNLKPLLSEVSDGTFFVSSVLVAGDQVIEYSPQVPNLRQEMPK